MRQPFYFNVLNFIQVEISAVRLVLLHQNTGPFNQKN